MNDPIREAFERTTAPTFGHELPQTRKSNGEHVSGILEDHWQTFQEGWESAMESAVKMLRTKNEPNK